MSATAVDGSNVSLDCEYFNTVDAIILDSATTTKLIIKEERPECHGSSSLPAENEILGTDGEGSSHSTAEEPERKRKKGPAPKMLGNEVCSVCGDKASGFHYNVLSCEGCKGFFRRSVIKNAKYTCKNNGNCQMDMYMRRKCQECRLRKCREAGMREQCVLSEEQIRSKKIKKQQHEEDAVRSSAALNPSLPSMLTHDIVHLTPQQEEMIQQLVSAQQQCNKRSFSDQPKVTPWPLANDPNSREARQQRFAHFTELAIISVQEIVDFAKQVPGFLELSREDQIALLKASTIEDHLMFPRMLMKLVSLRTLSSVHSEQVFALRLQDKKLPPLLSEIWDVHE